MERSPNTAWSGDTRPAAAFSPEEQARLFGASACDVLQGCWRWVSAWHLGAWAPVLEAASVRLDDAWRQAETHALARAADTEPMTSNDGIGIAILAIALITVIAVPGQPRWQARPWFIKGPPRRAPLAAFIAVLLVAAIAHALL